LAKAASGIVTLDEVTELSEKFEVSSLLIEHQLENHGIADLTRDDVVGAGPCLRISLPS